MEQGRTAKSAYSPAEVAVDIGLGMTKTRALIASGVIPSIRIGRLVRVRHNDLVAYLDSLAVDDQRAG